MMMRIIWNYIKNLINQSIEEFIKIFLILIQEFNIKIKIFININNPNLLFLNKEHNIHNLIMISKN